MTTRERIYSIPDLIVTERLQNMTDEELNEYIEVLNVFVVTFPAKEMKINSAMNSKNIDTVIKHLVDIGEMLRSIHADDLADECWKRLNSFDKNRPEKIEAYVSFLLSSITSLSLDIQMALSKREKIDTIAQSYESTKEQRIIKSILAVDDDVYSLYLFKAALKDAPCKIIAVNSGKEALNMLNKVKPNLFVLDIDMPGIDGIELARALRKQGQYAPIIFLTGNATKEYVQECLQVGAVDFIVKPINPQNVLNRIQKFL